MTGEDPVEIWHEVCSSYPDQTDAIVDELHTRTGFWAPPDTPTATVTPIRGAK